MKVKSVALLATLLTSWSLSYAGSPQKHACQRCGNPCDACELARCDVWVEQYVVEKRVRTRVVKVPKQREETYTVFRKVPVERKYERECCYLKRDVATQKVTKKECHLVDVPVERTKEVTRYFCERREVMLDSPCSCCEPQVRDVLVPFKSQEKEICTERRLVFTETKKDISYCIRVPKKKKIPCATDKTYELVPVEKKRIVTVCVPEIVREEIEVAVCKRVPKSMICCNECRQHYGCDERTAAPK